MSNAQKVNKHKKTKSNVANRTKHKFRHGKGKGGLKSDKTSKKRK